MLRIWKKLNLMFIDTGEFPRGRNPAAFSESSSLGVHGKLRVNQEGMQQVFTRWKKPVEKYKIIHVGEK